MKLKHIIFLFFYGVLFAPAVQADSGWTDYANVEELIPTNRHYYEFRLPVKDNPSGCRNKSRFYQDYSAFGSDKMFQTLLESVTSGKKIRLYVTGKCNLDGDAEISSVSIIP